MRKRDGFTLIELMTVVAILALLAAVLLPGIAAAKHAVGRANCSLNLHALGVSFTQYAAKHRVYPTYGSSRTSRARNYFLAHNGNIEDWTALHVEHHLPDVEVLFCPAMRSANHQYDTSKNRWASGMVRTGYSRRFLPAGSDGLTLVAKVRPGDALAADLLVSPATLRQQHQAGVNVLYADGNVVFRRDVLDLFSSVGVNGNTTASNAQLDAVWSALDRR